MHRSSVRGLAASIAITSLVAIVSYPNIGLADEPNQVPQAPAPWVNPLAPEEVRMHGLLDVRGFFHHVDGVADSRPNWAGAEILGYFDAVDGLSGAFILRQEARDEIGRYGVIMLIPRINERTYMVTSIGVGDGTPIHPLSRIDVQVRGFFKCRPRIMYDIGVFVTRWSEQRYQLIQSTAAILWLNPWMVELRYNSFFTLTPDESPVRDQQGTLVLLYGQDRRSWLSSRFSLGSEPENKLNAPPGPPPSQFTTVAALGYRWWATPNYGLMAEVEAYYQLKTWYRVGGTLSMFANF